jgi:hypothetical protein
MRSIDRVLGLGVALIFSVFSLVTSAAIANAFAGQTTRVSVSSAGDPARAALPSDTVSRSGVISADGRFVVFWSSVTNLVPGVVGGQVYRHDLTSGETVLVSASSTGAGGNNTSRDPSVSADGRFVVFSSTATDLVAGDANNGVSDVFVRDMDREPALGGATTLVSVNSAGEQGNMSSTLSGLSGAREISDDGAYVVFISSATNFDAVNNGVSQLYRKDMTSGALVRVSVNNAGEPADQVSQAPTISGDGATVAFNSSARNLTGDPTTAGIQQVFVRALSSGLTTMESVGAGTGRASMTPVLSETGQYLAFESDGVFDLYDLDNGTRDVYLRDRTSNTIELASRSPNNMQGALSFGPSISGDGRWVAYTSIDEMVFGSDPLSDTNGIVADVFIYDGESPRENPSVRYVSLNDADEQASLASVGASVSRDGSRVLFASAAPNLVTEPASVGSQLYVRKFVEDQPQPEVTLEWLAPVGDTFSVGRNLPVKFRVLTTDGSPVLDQSVQVDILDSSGAVVPGTSYVFGDQPSRSVTWGADSYHVNVDAKALEAGTYWLRVRFSSPTLSAEFTLATSGTANAVRSGLRD